MNPAFPAPLPAATVLLLRDGPRGIEVLMQRRRASLAFLGGMWVFPGGRHEPGDRDPAVLERIRIEPVAGGAGLGDAEGRER
jgi:8-oxo-dGTP pyrophosphatase MutT (NUDIX family)